MYLKKHHKPSYPSVIFFLFDLESCTLIAENLKTDFFFFLHQSPPQTWNQKNFWPLLQQYRHIPNVYRRLDKTISLNKQDTPSNTQYQKDFRHTDMAHPFADNTEKHPHQICNFHCNSRNHWIRMILFLQSSHKLHLFHVAETFNHLRSCFIHWEPQLVSDPDSNLEKKNQQIE